MKGLVPVAMLLIGRGCPREHPGPLPITRLPGESLRVTFDDVISDEKAPLGQILRNFWLRMRTPFQGSPPGSLRVTFDDVTSGQKAPLGRILCNFRLRMHTPFHILRGYVIFGHFW